jgi:pimeloyl-ACP methyl ester carboxylesterase
LPTGGTFFDYRGHAIFTRVGGPPSAPALLLIHGFPTSSWDWEAVWPTLTERFRVYTLDLIGFGYSAKPAHYRYSIHDQAELVQAYLRGQGVMACHVLAHDYGVSVAQELLSRQAQVPLTPMVRSIVFLNGGLFPDLHRPLLIQKLLLSPLGSWVAMLITHKRFAANMRHIFGPDTKPDAALIDDFWALVSANAGRVIMHRLIRYLSDRKTHGARWVNALLTASVPLKLICGGADPISGAHMAQHYQALVPNADVSVLSSIGHYPQIEAAGLVLAEFLAFQDKHFFAPSTDLPALSLPPDW